MCLLKMNKKQNRSDLTKRKTRTTSSRIKDGRKYFIEVLLLNSDMLEALIISAPELD